MCDSFANKLLTVPIIPCISKIFVSPAGSFAISVLAGKVMFRDVHYVTENYSLRIQLGYAIFRWWRPLIAKEINEGRPSCVDFCCEKVEDKKWKRSLMKSILHTKCKIFSTYHTLFCLLSDMSHSETRLSVCLDMFELHVFNRSGTYSRLEKMFGIDELIDPDPDSDGNKRDSKE